jgi:hypothetical protein
MEQITNKPRRRRRSQHEILNLLNEFEKAGVSVKEFCGLHSISKATFHKWQSRYKTKKEQEDKPTGLPTGQAGFADLHITPSTATANEVLFAEVKGIKIYQPVTASYLKELLQ